MASRLFRFKRFSTQLMLVLAGLFAVVQAAVYLLVSSANTRNAIEHIEQNLTVGAKVFHQTMDERIGSLASSAQVMSNDYAIKSVFLQDPIDLATLRTTLVSYTSRVQAPIITIFSPDKELLTSTDQSLDTTQTKSFQTLIGRAEESDDEGARGYSYLRDQLYVLVVVPLYAPKPNVIAWFGLAYPINTAFANRVKSTTLLDVTFLTAAAAPTPRALATTLTEPLAAELARHRSEMSRAERLDLDHEPYVTLFEPLEVVDAAPARIALQRSLNAELAPARDLERVMLVISLVALSAAILLAFGLARSISRPVQQLARHTQLVASGDYSQHIELPRSDELGQLANAFNQMTAGLAERDRVRNLLGLVVSPEIATQLMHSELKLGGEEREVTVLFCDLRDFTTLSEKLSPTEILSLLNRYFDRMSAIIERHGGVIDKYIGDAIMALFGAPVAVPDAPARAVAAARDMARALQSLNGDLHNEGKPPLAFGVGINTARVVAGNIGSKTRLNYTVIGDGVNLASRLEGLTKDPAYATPIIVSDATLAEIHPRPFARELGEVKVKGKSEPVKVFALSPRGETQRPYSV